MAFQKGEVQASLDRFEQMLAKQPDNWLVCTLPHSIRLVVSLFARMYCVLPFSTIDCHLQALSRLVDYERRAGHLEDVPRLFSMCERTLGEARANSDSGYHFCKGTSSLQTTPSLSTGSLCLRRCSRQVLNSTLICSCSRRPVRVVQGERGCGAAPPEPRASRQRVGPARALRDDRDMPQPGQRDHRLGALRRLRRRRRLRSARCPRQGVRFCLSGSMHSDRLHSVLCA